MLFDLIQARRSARIQRDAARWIAHLHSDRCSDHDRRRFTDWLAYSADHAAGFEEASQAWADLGYMPAMPSAAARKPDRGLRINRRGLLAALGGTAAAGGGIFAWSMAEAKTYETGLGERRHVDVGTGLGIELDALSRVRVSGGGGKIDIEEGRVRIVVQNRSADVRVAKCRFATRSAVLDIECRQGGLQHLAVLEGQGLLEKGGANPAESMAAPSLLDGKDMRISHPDATEIDRLTAWQEGRAIFNDESLGDAIAVMNRYDPDPLRLQDSSLADLRISGVFKLGHNDRFVEALTVLLPISARRDSAGWVLTRSPAA